MHSRKQRTCYRYTVYNLLWNKLLLPFKIYAPGIAFIHSKFCVATPEGEEYFGMLELLCQKGYRFCKFPILLSSSQRKFDFYYELLFISE